MHGYAHWKMNTKKLFDDWLQGKSMKNSLGVEIQVRNYNSNILSLHLVNYCFYSSVTWILPFYCFLRSCPFAACRTRSISRSTNQFVSRRSRFVALTQFFSILRIAFLIVFCAFRYFCEIQQYFRWSQEGKRWLFWGSTWSIALWVGASTSIFIEYQGSCTAATPAMLCAHLLGTSIDVAGDGDSLLYSTCSLAAS